MTATVYAKKGRPNYSIILRYKGETGKEQTKTITTDLPIKGNNKRKAEKLKDEILAQYMKDKVDIGKDSLFTDFIKDWLETRRKTGKIQQTTHDSYVMTLNAHILPFFEPLHLRLKEIEPRHIQNYVNKKLERVSVNTIKKHMANLVACLDSAVKQNIIPFNPAKRIEELKKVKFTGAKFLSEKEIVQMLNCFKGDPLEIVILLTLFYGLRRSETLGIKWGALDFNKNTLAINHTVVKVANTTHRKDLTKNEIRQQCTSAAAEFRQNSFAEMANRASAAQGITAQQLR